MSELTSSATASYSCTMSLKRTFVVLSLKGENEAMLGDLVGEEMELEHETEAVSKVSTSVSAGMESDDDDEEEDRRILRIIFFRFFFVFFGCFLWEGDDFFEKKARKRNVEASFWDLDLGDDDDDDRRKRKMRSSVRKEEALFDFDCIFEPDYLLCICQDEWSKN
jgi:hypothetical protein